jgi:hypothetical protein
MRASIPGLLAAVLTLAACSGAQFSPVQLQGDPMSISALAGSWAGEYAGGAGGRAGSLSFNLRSGSDSLYGDVTMTDPTGQAIRAVDAAEIHRTHVQSPQQLRIDFVAVRADSVRGTLEPYMSPDCNCVVGTTFLGQRSGNEIKGTFETRSGGQLRAQGTWAVKRTASGG